MLILCNRHIREYMSSLKQQSRGRLIPKCLPTAQNGASIIGSWSGGAIGAKAGAYAGAMIGSAIFPGPGTLVGGVVGSLVLGIAGSIGGSAFGEWIVDISNIWE